MSKLQETQIVPLSAIAASAALSVPSTEQTRNSENHRTCLSRIGINLTFMAISLGGLAISASAQNPISPRIVAERHFTVAPHALNRVVLQTEPEAACSLHPAGDKDPAKTMTLYANIEGYVQFHFIPNEETEAAACNSIVPLPTQ
jgi:hypothetical protein